ncbi:hypothetical protein C8R45DRAFT_1080406 [Mycena sanguinolenta]|nr:hypothetical protein C8R45DRAFT_1080406 [Mycena sanguinolenta]
MSGLEIGLHGETRVEFPELHGRLGEKIRWSPREVELGIVDRINEGNGTYGRCLKLAVNRRGSVNERLPCGLASPGLSGVRRIMSESANIVTGGSSVSLGSVKGENFTRRDGHNKRPQLSRTANRMQLEDLERTRRRRGNKGLERREESSSDTFPLDAAFATHQLVISLVHSTTMMDLPKLASPTKKRGYNSKKSHPSRRESVARCLEKLQSLDSTVVTPAQTAIVT